jgi:protein tyrosine/serine phosphatase
MDAPTETDLQFYKDHNVAYEIDLRASTETQWENVMGNAPSWRGRASTPVTTLRFPIATIPSDHAYDVGSDDRDIAYANTMLTIANRGQPVLIHCTHGADRTGMDVAVIMQTLGYSRAAAKEEYLRTTAAADQGSVSSDNFDHAMDDIVDRYGSFAGYLSHLHDLVPAFNASTIANLKTALLR